MILTYFFGPPYMYIGHLMFVLSHVLHRPFILKPFAARCVWVGFSQRCECTDLWCFCIYLECVS